ncbi:hypothetical protein GT037_003265 [Alternaria burnsii]|uniref:Uncharacterized protein n=1 Tax=Alternaria burnsii TaxID=1187904 RepID=A0A8H7BCK7_9PLEO|nr:uncharacterized protein GT037_003265 [Alternaria burnsii]KAF7679517.1 hypothetical protein GT037_003265 [Alternaria burnsii]
MCADAPVCRNSPRDYSNPRPFARRGGIAKRGEGSLSTTPGYYEKELRAFYYRTKASHAANIETDTDTYPPSPPLSPKTTVTPLKVRRTQRVERKRDHPYQQPPSNRRPSWRPNLKQELLRRSSIDSIVDPFNDVGWFETDCQVSATQKRCGTVSLSNHGDVEMPKSRRHSTLLHPSSPDTEPAGSVNSFDAPSTSNSVMASRKGSSLLHPSSPASDIPLGVELKTVMCLPQKSLWGEGRAH